MKIILAQSLFAATGDGGAGFDITMPSGYTCNIPSQVNPATGKQETAALYNPWGAPQDLRVFWKQPQGRGTPNSGEYIEDTTSHGWSVDPASPNKCSFQLRRFGFLPAGTPLFLRFNVDNPQHALPQADDASNKWILSQYSKANLSQYWEMDSVIVRKYISIEQHAPPSMFNSVISDENYTSALAVRGFLSDTVLMPSDYLSAFSIHKNLPVRSYVYVWFRTEQAVGLQGYVVVDAPMEINHGASEVDHGANAGTVNRTGFLFDAVAGVCDAGKLPRMYYATRPRAELTHPLPGGVDECWYVKNHYYEVRINMLRTGVGRNGSRGDHRVQRSTEGGQQVEVR